MSVFSFHGSKTLTTGEGGLLATNDTALFTRAQVLRDHGRPAGDRFFRNTEVAYKYKMSSLQAALGLAQLERLDELVARKREIFGWYQARLGDVPGLSMNSEHGSVYNSFWMSTIVLDERHRVTKEELMSGLDAAGIDSRPFFYPLSSLEAYANQPEAINARQRNRISYATSPRAINLPSGLSLTEADAHRVSEVLRNLIRV